MFVYFSGKYINKNTIKTIWLSENELDIIVELTTINSRTEDYKYSCERLIESYKTSQEAKDRLKDFKFNLTRSIV